MLTVELTERDVTLILAGLFELRITHLEHADRCAAIDAPWLQNWVGT